MDGGCGDGEGVFLAGDGYKDRTDKLEQYIDAVCVPAAAKIARKNGQ